MALQTPLIAMRLKRPNLVNFHGNCVRTGALFHSICRPVVLYKTQSPTVLSRSLPNFSCSGFSRPKNGVLLFNEQYKIQAVVHKSSFQGQKDKDIEPSNEDMNLRHSVENDYLSWMRNTYMMTLAGLTILNTGVVVDNWIISRIVFFTSSLNLTAGTIGYLHSLSSLRKRKVMKTFSSICCQIAAIFHLFLWMSVLTLIISPERKEEDGKEKTMDNIQE